MDGKKCFFPIKCMGLVFRIAQIGTEWISCKIYTNYEWLLENLLPIQWRSRTRVHFYSLTLRAGLHLGKSEIESNIANEFVKFT